MLFGLVILGWNGSINSWNLILSEILGPGIFLGWVGAKLAKWHFYQIYPNQTFANFAPTCPRKIPSPKISLKIKFREFLDPFQLKISRPNNFFWAKIVYFWHFLAKNPKTSGQTISRYSSSEPPNLVVTWDNSHCCWSPPFDLKRLLPHCDGKKSPNDTL